MYVYVCVCVINIYIYIYEYLREIWKWKYGRSVAFMTLDMTLEKTEIDTLKYQMFQQNYVKFYRKIFQA